MNFWSDIKKLLEQYSQLMLLVVLTNEGSSPGKQGFKMAVTADGSMIGTIGGGIMEQKLVELAKKLLEEDNPDLPFIKRQIHDKKAGKDQSGMICSGEQTVGFYHLTFDNSQTINNLIHSETGALILNQSGLEFDPNARISDLSFEQKSDSDWKFQESIEKHNTVHIVGAGHVGLALSRTLYHLGFYIHIYDDRDNLFTLNQNAYAHQKHTIVYEELGSHIAEGDDNYIVLVSFGYRTDKIALKQLLNHKVKYLGMMGSEAKIKQLYSELEAEGISRSALDKVYAPIGITKHNKTAEEIALSIAAQIVMVKNDINN